MGVNNSWGGVALNASSVASPCGAIGNILIIQLKLSLMTLFKCLHRIILKYLLIKRASRGLETKDINIKGSPIVIAPNG